MPSLKEYWFVYLMFGTVIVGYCFLIPYLMGDGVDLGGTGHVLLGSLILTTLALMANTWMQWKLHEDNREKRNDD